MKKITTYVIWFAMMISIIGCSLKEAYDEEEAIKRGDVVVDYFQEEIHNVDIFKQFIKNVANNKEDSIRLTSYTLEGDLIFQDLQFDGEVIDYRYNDSYDQFGGDDRGIETDVCNEITQEENEKGEIEYFVSGCSKDLNEKFFFLRMKKTNEG